MIPRQFDDAEELWEVLSNEGEWDEASETQGQEEAGESGGSDQDEGENSNDGGGQEKGPAGGCPFRSCVWHLPEEQRGVKRKRGVSESD